MPNAPPNIIKKKYALLSFDLIIKYIINKLTKIGNYAFYSPPRHPFIKRAIDIIIDNVSKKYYGKTPLDSTGPVLLGKAVNQCIGKKELFTEGIYSWNQYKYEIFLLFLYLVSLSYFLYQ